MLGFVWLIFRTGEGLIQFINEPNYWKLINIARQYSGASGAEKGSLSDLARSIFKIKDYRFKFAMMCWSIGTLAFSIVLITSGVVPELIGWLGIGASILMSLWNAIKIAKLNSKNFSPIGGMASILFEVIIGAWLLFSPII